MVIGWVVTKPPQGFLMLGHPCNASKHRPLPHFVAWGAPAARDAWAGALLAPTLAPVGAAGLFGLTPRARVSIAGLVTWTPRSTTVRGLSLWADLQTQWRFVPLVRLRALIYSRTLVARLAQPL